MQNCRDKIHFLPDKVGLFALIFTSHYNLLFDRSSSAHVSSQSVSVQYSVGWWDGKLVTDKIKLGVMSAVTASFTMITRAEQFYIAGADWVGIMGLAYESIAAVSVCCVVLM